MGMTEKEVRDFINILIAHNAPLSTKIWVESFQAEEHRFFASRVAGSRPCGLKNKFMDGAEKRRKLLSQVTGKNYLAWLDERKSSL